ncbi:hypothetical protein D3C76_945140 [compost metagenome]
MTVIAEVAVLVGSDTLVAVMTAEPAATPVTRPDELTGAINGAELPQVKFCPAPDGSADAVSWRVAATAIEAVAGVTETLVTGTNGTRVMVVACLATV